MLAINWKPNKEKLTNLFYRSRMRLTVLYSTLMFFLFCLIIFCAHLSMQWAVTSEQIREMSATLHDVVETERLLLQDDSVPDDLGYRERMFFYAYDAQGRLCNYSRAPVRIENDVLKVIQEGKVPFDDVAVFEQREADEPTMVLMMQGASVEVNGHVIGQVYLGKDLTALYKGIKKSTYFLGAISLLALIVAAAVGYNISGKVMAPMEAAYERQRQFAADASHELRTPLSVVMASADVLANDPSIQSPFLQQVIGDLKDEVKKMSKLVGDLLTIARSDNSMENINVAEFDFSADLQQVVRNMQMMAEKKKIDLTSDIPDGIKYLGNEQKIKQLMLIFVDNAIKYTPESGRIVVKALLGKGKTVGFSVADTGIGVAKEDYRKIFGRFYRVDKARSRAMGGNGLGLAIAKDIVEAHHGQIYIESELGKGTTFTIELNPLK